ncbi:MAG: DapH/DapD/GlmU-related protein [Candidatus Aminicenantaceae bacterium]
MRTQTEFGDLLIDKSTSPLKKYQDIAVGTSNLLFFIKYETILILFGGMPGAIGLFLRRIFFKRLFKRTGRNVVFGRNVTIRHPKRIEIGNNVIIDDNCVLDAKGNSDVGISIGDNVIINRNTILSCKNGIIKIGDNTNIGTNCLLHSVSSLILEENILIAAYCYIVAGGNHDFKRTDIPMIQQPAISKGGILVKNDVWFGAGVKVLDGVKIDRGTIVGAGAVVTKDIPAFSIAMGTPAKVVRSRK